jgi:hypothetical protein
MSACNEACEHRGMAALLLITQAALALLAALGLHTYVRLSNASAQLALPQLIAFAGPLLLVLMAVGVLNRSRAAAISVYLWEAVTIVGTTFSILASGGSGLLLTSGLTGLALPTAIVYFVHRPTDVRRNATTVLLLATAFIHLSLVPEHISASPALGRLFLFDGLGFLFMAYSSTRQSNWWRLPAAALLAATIAAYLAVVLKGQETVDDVGVATKFIELLALGLIVWPREPNRLNWRWGLAGLTLVGSIVFSGGLAWAATLRPSAEGGHTHAAGKTLIAEAAPTEQQKTAATQLVDDTRAGIARFADVNLAIADGYRPTTPLKAPTVHYVNPKYARSGLVDPEHPQALVYANASGGSLLLGAMYMMPKANRLPPEIGGSITEWHTHNNLCFLIPGLMIDGLESPFGTCPVGSINGPTPAMLHVWIVPNPAGPFADLTPAYVARLTSRTV